jgi:hypothetical protein
MFVQVLALAVMTQPVASQGPYVRSVSPAVVKWILVNDDTLWLDIGGARVETTRSRVIKAWKFQSCFSPAFLQPPVPEFRRVWECGVLGQSFFVIWINNEPILGLKRPRAVGFVQAKRLPCEFSGCPRVCTSPGPSGGRLC